MESKEPAENSNQPEDVVCAFKKPSKGNKNIRKRPSDGDTAVNDDAQTQIIIKQKIEQKNNPMIQSTEKQQKLETMKYQTSGTTTVGSRDQLATATLETETEHDKDATSISKRAKVKDDGLYHGMNAYSEFIEKRESASGLAKGAGIRAGPVRAPIHIRMTSRIDYQPDLCKDYKETGYCGYGDACKFMHDRGDYKNGWQLDRDWDEQEKRRAEERLSGGPKKEQEEKEDDLPIACYLCKNPFTNPVVTRCNHYFCEKCALDHHSKNKKCFVCNEPTLGIFNHPKKLVAKLKEKQAQQQNEQQEPTQDDAEAPTEDNTQ